MSAPAGSKLSFLFGIAAIVFVAIDLFAGHRAVGVAAIVCILLAMLTRPSGFFGRRGRA
jgi:membrane-bound ClpP family serine protease